MSRTRIDVLNDRRMNLPDLRQRPWVFVSVDCPNGIQKQRTIPLNIRFRIEFRQSKVERLAAIAGRDATGPRAESMDQPRDPREGTSAQYLDGLGGWFCRLACDGHTLILAN